MTEELRCGDLIEHLNMKRTYKIIEKQTAGFNATSVPDGVVVWLPNIVLKADYERINNYRVGDKVKRVDLYGKWTHLNKLPKVLEIEGIELFKPGQVIYYVIDINSGRRLFEPLLEEELRIADINKVAASGLCTCDISTIMATGCKCGGK